MKTGKQIKQKKHENGIREDARNIQNIKNKEIVIIGGFVKIEIVSAILSFFSSVSSYLFSVLMSFKPNNYFPP